MGRDSLEKIRSPIEKDRQISRIWEELVEMQERINKQEEEIHILKRRIQNESGR